MDEFTLPEGVRAMLPMVGESLILAISPDKADGLSDAELALFRAAGPKLFEVLEGKALPHGFSVHFKDEVIRDISKVRDDPAVRDSVRSELLAVLRDPEKMKSLYTPGGDTFSDILNRGATRGTEQTGMFRESGSAVGRIRRRMNGGVA